MNPQPPSEDKSGSTRPPTLWQTMLSVMAAFFGVQSERNRQRDFSSGRPLAFILVGLLATLGFIGTLVLAVRLMLQQAG